MRTAMNGCHIFSAFSSFPRGRTMSPPTAVDDEPRARPTGTHDYARGPRGSSLDKACGSADEGCLKFVRAGAFGWGLLEMNLEEVARRRILHACFWIGGGECRGTGDRGEGRTEEALDLCARSHASSDRRARAFCRGLTAQIVRI